MNKFNLHYASLNSVGDIEHHKFNKHDDMIDFIDRKCIGRISKCVWLISMYGSNDIFISESYLSIEFFMQNMPCWETAGTYFLQEYQSYEDAYSVALDILENEELRFNQK